MRRWALPVMLGLLAVVAGWFFVLWASPFLLMRAATDRVAMVSSVNRMTAAPLATAERRAVVRPSPDLFYSICPYDISKGAVLVDVPGIADAYWSVAVYDARTDVVVVRSVRNAVSLPVRLALIPPDGDAPAGYEPVVVDYATGLVLLRVLLPEPGQSARLDAERRRATCRLLPVTG